MDHVRLVERGDCPPRRRAGTAPAAASFSSARARGRPAGTPGVAEAELGGARIRPGPRPAWATARSASVDDRLDVGAQGVRPRGPRSPSLAPVSITSTATGCRSSQSIRRRAPADVSPLTPAFTASKRSPADVELPLDQRGIRLVRIEAEPGGEAGAEKHDPAAARRRPVAAAPGRRLPVVPPHPRRAPRAPVQPADAAIRTWISFRPCSDAHR